MNPDIDKPYTLEAFLARDRQQMSKSTVVLELKQSEIDSWLRKGIKDGYFFPTQVEKGLKIEHSDTHPIPSKEDGKPFCSYEGEVSTETVIRPDKNNDGHLEKVVDVVICESPDEDADSHPDWYKHFMASKEIE